jgi:hypothetical protein
MLQHRVVCGVSGAARENRRSAHIAPRRYFLAGSAPESNHLWMKMELQAKNIARHEARTYPLNI